MQNSKNQDFVHNVKGDCPIENSPLTPLVKRMIPFSCLERARKSNNALDCVWPGKKHIEAYYFQQFWGAKNKTSARSYADLCHVAFVKICPVENVFCTEDAHWTFSMPHTLNWQLQNWRDSRLQILATPHLAQHRTNIHIFTWASQVVQIRHSLHWEQAIQTGTDWVNVKSR